VINLLFIPIHPNKPGPTAQKIRNLARYWLLNNKLPVSKQGKHQKIIRIIDDDDVADFPLLFAN
jgi:hypothetical protein